MGQSKAMSVFQTFHVLPTRSGPGFYVIFPLWAKTLSMLMVRWIPHPFFLLTEDTIR